MSKSPKSGRSGLRSRLRALIESIELRGRAVYFASRDSRVPFVAKALAAVVAAYALSPIDLIPDFIPILGLLDDLVLIPLGIALVVRMMPTDVWQECLAAARQVMDAPRSRAGLVAVLLIWVAALVALGWIVASRI